MIFRNFKTWTTYTIQTTCVILVCLLVMLADLDLFFFFLRMNNYNNNNIGTSDQPWSFVLMLLMRVKNNQALYHLIKQWFLVIGVKNKKFHLSHQFKETYKALWDRQLRRREPRIPGYTWNCHITEEGRVCFTLAHSKALNRNKHMSV